MLDELTVKGFGIIDAITWRPGPGLNVITGETGAGKSLVGDAVDALLSGQVKEEDIRHGETAARVAAGAIAKKLLSRRGVRIIAYTLRAARVSCATIDYEEIERNPMRAPDPEAAVEMVKRVKELAEAGNSTGGIVECVVKGVQPGLGDPVFEKLDAEIARGMLSLGAVKGIEFGAGFAAADMRGSDLTQANFTGADVSGANFTDARMAGANLARAKTEGAVDSHGNRMTTRKKTMPQAPRWKFWAKSG